MALTLKKIKETIAFPKDSEMYKSLSGICDCTYHITKKSGKSEKEALLTTLDKLGDELLKFSNKD